MFALLRHLLLLICILAFSIFMACSDSDGFDAEQLESDTFDSYATVLSSDFNRLEANGIGIDSSNGVFSIGWNQFFNPMTNDTVTHGHAFAVAFDEVNSQGPRPIKNGIDIGSVFINYQNNHIELQKIFNPVGGVLYSLFPRPNMGNALDFIPGATYEFEVTGSPNFGPINIPLTAPSALMDFTSHTNGDSIDANSDLVLTWTGGTSGDPVAIHILPRLNFHPIFGGMQNGGRFGNNGNVGSGFRNGPRFGQGGRPGPRPMPHPLPVHLGIFEVLQSNPGQYTVAAADLQNLLSNTNATGIICHVSQINGTEVNHEGRILRAVMRNGDRLMLSIQ